MTEAKGSRSGALRIYPILRALLSKATRDNGSFRTRCLRNSLVFDCVSQRPRRSSRCLCLRLSARSDVTAQSTPLRLPRSPTSRMWRHLGTAGSTRPLPQVEQVPSRPPSIIATITYVEARRLEADHRSASAAMLK